VYKRMPNQGGARRKTVKGDDKYVIERARLILNNHVEGGGRKVYTGRLTREGGYHQGGTKRTITMYKGEKGGEKTNAGKVG